MKRYKDFLNENIIDIKEEDYILDTAHFEGEMSKLMRKAIDATVENMKDIIDIFLLKVSIKDDMLILENDFTCEFAFKIKIGFEYDDGIVLIALSPSEGKIYRKFQILHMIYRSIFSPCFKTDVKGRKIKFKISDDIIESIITKDLTVFESFDNYLKFFSGNHTHKEFISQEMLDKYAYIFKNDLF